MTTKKKVSNKKTDSSKKTLVKKARKKATNATSAKSSGKNKDFTAVFAALRKILTPYEGRLAPRQRDPGYFYMESLEPTYKEPSHVFCRC